MITGKQARELTGQGETDWGLELLGPAAQAEARAERERLREPKWDPARAMPLGDRFSAGFASDPNARMGYYAERRFPKLSPEQRASRYRIVNGRVAFRDDPKREDQWFYEEPEFNAGDFFAPLAAGGPVPGIPNPAGAESLTAEDYQRAGDSAAAVIAGAPSALPTVGAAIGGIGGAMVGHPVLGVTGGAAAGSLLQQGVGNLITGQPISPGRVATDTAWELGGYGVGRGLSGAYGAIRGGVLPRVTPEMEARAAAQMAEQGRRGISISMTPDELTGDPALRVMRVGMENTTEGSRRMLDFYRGRNKQVEEAVNSILGRLSPGTPSVYSASRMGQEGAEAAIAAERKALADQAGPYYEAARGMRIEPTEGMIRLAERPAVRTAMTKAERLAANRGEPIDKASLAYWDYTKRALDDMIADANRRGAREELAGLTDAKSRLVRELDAQTRIVGDDLGGPATRAGSPYAQGREIYTEGMPRRTDLERGTVGAIAELNPREIDRASDILFGASSSADEVKLAREAFERAGQNDAWRALLRAHLERQLTSLPDEPVGTVRNVAAMYRKRLLGTEAKRRMLREAFAGQGDVAEDFDWLMSTFDAINRGAQSRSHDLIVKDAVDNFRRMARGMAPPEEALVIWRTPAKIEAFINDMRSKRFASRIADLMTSPDGLAQLRAMKGISPRSASAIVWATFLMLPRPMRYTAPPSGYQAEALGSPPERTRP